FITASISNIITIEFLRIYLDVEISYLKWFLLMLPLWVTLTFISWLLLATLLNKKTFRNSNVGEVVIKKLPPVKSQEYYILGCLLFSVFIWVTQEIHGLPLSFPLILTIVFLSIVNKVDWKRINTVQV